MPPASDLSQLGPLVFPVFFVGMWFLVTFIISHLGWHQFAIHYPAPSRPPGRAHNSPTTRFANFFGSYRNVVRIVFTEGGIYFYALFLFRAFHPPFLVPWSSVKIIEKKGGLLGSYLRLDIEDSVGEIHVILTPKVEPELLKFSPISGCMRHDNEGDIVG